VSLSFAPWTVEAPTDTVVELGKQPQANDSSQSFVLRRLSRQGDASVLIKALRYWHDTQPGSTSLASTALPKSSTRPTHSTIQAAATAPDAERVNQRPTVSSAMKCVYVRQARACLRARRPALLEAARIGECLRSPGRAERRGDARVSSIAAARAATLSYS
jgi:hypothetical protein